MTEHRKLTTIWKRTDYDKEMGGRSVDWEAMRIGAGMSPAEFEDWKQEEIRILIAGLGGRADT